MSENRACIVPIALSGAARVARQELVHPGQPAALMSKPGAAREVAMKNLLRRQGFTKANGTNNEENRGTPPERKTNDDPAWTKQFTQQLSATGGGEKAFRQLLAEGCDERILLQLLRNCSVRSETGFSQKRAQQVSKQLQNIVSEMGGLKRRAVVDPVTIAHIMEVRIGSEPFFSQLFRWLPGTLLSYAVLLEYGTKLVSEKYPTRGFHNPFPVCLLCEYVRIVTGKRHYPEIATLLEATYRKGIVSAEALEKQHKRFERRFPKFCYFALSTWQRQMAFAAGGLPIPELDALLSVLAQLASQKKPNKRDRG